MRFVHPDPVWAYYYGEGKQFRAYRTLGAHRTRQNGEEGTFFAVWAPEALAVSVIGSFNRWDPVASPLQKLEKTSVWCGFIPHVTEGAQYKYAVLGKDEKLRSKADPVGFASQLRPDTASVVVSRDEFAWTDDGWMAERARKGDDFSSRPMNIYEVHASSWKQVCVDGKGVDFFRVGEELAEYAALMHYTHVELLPVAEHPLDESWGYQCTGYYAPTARLGSPDALKHFVDACHSRGVGVILDWVPGHFCKDDPGLRHFDGTDLYGYITHPQWGTLRFDFRRTHVTSFLVSNAMYWLEEFHVDGFRVDGLASMLSLNFGSDSVKYLNVEGKDEDLAAEAFLRTFNTEVRREYPGVVTIAEDSSTFPGVTANTEEGGLGFCMKWNLGWMHDTLDYMSLDPLYRKGSHNRMTFGMTYAMSEHFVLPFSHDEVVHGKRSLIGRMPGEYDEKFANLRLTLAWQIAHPGKKLLFMGGEFGQFIEWRYNEPLEWFMLGYPPHAQLQAYVRELNRFYLEHPALYERDRLWSGFEWKDVDDADASIYSFLRRGECGEEILCVFNCTPVPHSSHRIGVKNAGTWREVFHSGIKLKGTDDPIQTEKIPMHGCPYSITVELPGLTAVFLKREQKTAHEENKGEH